MFFSISKPSTPKIVRKYRAAWNFLQIDFVTLSDYANRIIIISIMKFYTSASLVLKSGLLIFRRKKAKFRGILRGKFAEKSADFAGFLREKVKIRGKIGRFRGVFAGEKSKFAEKSADFAGFFWANFAKIDQFCVDMISVV